MESRTQWFSVLQTSLAKTRCKTHSKESTLENALAEMQKIFVDLRRTSRHLWWAGNGGSSGLCAHLSQDVLNKLKVKSLVLADAPLLTCMANDFGYENIYSRPFELLVEKGDALIAVSSSGKSQNILNAAAVAQKKGAKLITLSAFSSDNPLFALPADVSLFLPTDLYGIAEVGHEALIHAAIETLWLEER